MTQVFDFFLNWFPKLVSILSLVPVTEFLKSLKKKNYPYYKPVLGITITIYLATIITFICSLIFVKVPDIQNESYNSVKKTLGDLGLICEIKENEFSEYNERDYYVNIDDSWANQYVRRGNVVELNVCGVSSALEQIYMIKQLYNDQYEANKKLITLLNSMISSNEGINISSTNEYTPSPVPYTGDPSLETNTSDATETNTPDATETSNSGTTEISNHDATAFIQPAPDISITFTDIQYDDSYYREYYADYCPGVTFVSEQGPGIHGTFTYSRPLTQEERDHWGHTGVLYDSNGNIVGEPGNNPSFWSWYDGNYAVEFPANFQHGTYTYEIIQFIGEQTVTATIQFTY